MSGYEFGNVLDVSYGAYVVKGVYSGNTNLKETSNRKNEAVATIRELLRGNIADVRQSVKESSTAVSTVQKFFNATDSIITKLSKMYGLTKKASNPDYSQVQVEEMQKEFEGLAKEINDTVKGTEHNNNKIFTSSGESMSIPIGDGSKIDIITKDFSFDIEGLDITKDPETASSSVKEMIQKIEEYHKHLEEQLERVEGFAMTMESEIEDVMGIDLEDFTMITASEISSNTENLLSEDKSTSLDSQANFTPDEVIKLLKDEN